MANGYQRQRRAEMVDQAILVWGLGDINQFDYVMFGKHTESRKGKPLKLDDELELKVQAEMERLREANPNLPKVTM
jgi:hypothetical protein